MRCKPEGRLALRPLPSMAATFGLWLIFSLGLAGCATVAAPPTPEAARTSPGRTVAGPATTGAAPAQSAKASLTATRQPDLTSLPHPRDESTAQPVDEALPPPDYRNSVYFGLASYAVGREAEAVLKRHAAKLNRNPRLVVTLVGHTDDLGSREYNDALCLKRARAVEKALLDLGVAPRQIRLAARYGYEKSPVRPCKTDACRKLLRKVELIYPN